MRHWVLVPALGLFIVGASVVDSLASCTGSWPIVQGGVGPEPPGRLLLPNPTAAVGGFMWQRNQGDPADGEGRDTNSLISGFPVGPADDPWIDRGSGSVVIHWDWMEPGMDGCASGGGFSGTLPVLVAYVLDNDPAGPNYALLAVRGVSPSEVRHDFDTLMTGVGPNGNDVPLVPLSEGVRPIFSNLSVLDLFTLQADVAPAVEGVNLFFDSGGPYIAVVSTVELQLIHRDVDGNETPVPCPPEVGCSAVALPQGGEICWVGEAQPVGEEFAYCGATGVRCLVDASCPDYCSAAPPVLCGPTDPVTPDCLGGIFGECITEDTCELQETIPFGPPIPGGCTPVPECGAEEVCDDIDNDCDGFVDEDDVCNQPPMAVATTEAEVECDSPGGALVILDGASSYDPDSTPGTNDDIVAFEWFEDFGLPSEMFIETGETLSVQLSLGVHVLTLRVTDSFGETDTDEVVVTVVDSTPPSISLSLAPSKLWPPNHRMMDVEASVTASDTCSAPAIVLTSISSNEADNGIGDGKTINDIQGAEIGTTDLAFQLRAERSGIGDGRTYTVMYSATDSSGNVETATASVFVPHDQDGVTEPLLVSIREDVLGMVVEWEDVPGAAFYNMVRGELKNVRDKKDFYHLGELACMASGVTQTRTAGFEDPESPDTGETFFYLVEYNDGLPGGYGTESSDKERFVPPGQGCP